MLIRLVLLKPLSAHSSRRPREAEGQATVLRLRRHPGARELWSKKGPTYKPSDHGTCIGVLQPSSKHHGQLSLQKGHQTVQAAGRKTPKTGKHHQEEYTDESVTIALVASFQSQHNFQHWQLSRSGGIPIGGGNVLEVGHSCSFWPLV